MACTNKTEMHKDLEHDLGRQFEHAFHMGRASRDVVLRSGDVNFGLQVGGEAGRTSSTGVILARLASEGVAAVSTASASLREMASARSYSITSSSSTSSRARLIPCCCCFSSTVVVVASITKLSSSSPSASPLRNSPSSISGSLDLCGQAGKTNQKRKLRRS